MDKALLILEKVGDELDHRKMTDLANEVTAAMRHGLMIKQAQYNGIQGYWIRNRRCWDNCYRQKRASNKSKSAQEVWFECHSEYLKSINNDRTEWDKYADSISKKIKVASAEQEQSFFLTRVADRLHKGASPESSIRNTLREGEDRYDQNIYMVASSLSKIAERLNERGEEELAKCIVAATDEIIKESWIGLDMIERRNKNKKPGDEVKLGDEAKPEDEAKPMWGAKKNWFGGKKAQPVDPAMSDRGPLDDNMMGASENKFRYVLGDPEYREQAINLIFSEPWLLNQLAKAVNARGKVRIAPGRSAKQHKGIKTARLMQPVTDLNEVADLITQNPSQFMNSLLDSGFDPAAEGHRFTAEGYNVTDVATGKPLGMQSADPGSVSDPWEAARGEVGQGGFNQQNLGFNPQVGQQDFQGADMSSLHDTGVIGEGTEAAEQQAAEQAEQQTGVSLEQVKSFMENLRDSEFTRGRWSDATRTKYLNGTIALLDDLAQQQSVPSQIEALGNPRPAGVTPRGVGGKEQGRGGGRAASVDTSFVGVKIANLIKDWEKKGFSSRPF